MAARRALAQTAPRHACRRDSRIRICGGEELLAQSRVWSKRARRRRRTSRAWNSHRLARRGAAPLVRIAMHPADALQPQVMANWRGMFDQVVASRTCVREFDALETTLGT